MTLDQFNQAKVVAGKLCDAFNELYLLLGEASPPGDMFDDQRYNSAAQKTSYLSRSRWRIEP